MNKGIKTITLRNYIKKHMQKRDYDIPERKWRGLAFTVRVPIFIKYIETVLDKKKIAKEGLRVYEREGIECIEDEEHKTAKLFKWGVVVSELTFITEKYIIDEFERTIKEKIDSGIEQVEVMGYCDKEEDCEGHVCGTKTYHYDGFCNLDIKQPTEVKK